MDEHLVHSNLVSRNQNFKKITFPRQTECLHSRNVMALLDLPNDSKNIKFLESHVNHCKTCSEALISSQHFLRQVDLAIPCFRADQEVLSGLQNEIHDVFSKIDFHHRDNLFVKKTDFSKNVGRVIDDLLEITISWKMVPVYVGAWALFMGLLRI